MRIRLTETYRLHKDIGEKDNHGNQLTKEQKIFFKNSKVRDQDGRLLVCYHNTNADFQTFDTQKQGSRFTGNLGNGFYFTPYKDQADYYGGKYTMEVYLLATNLFDTNSQEDMENLLRKNQIVYDKKAVRDAMQKGMATRNILQSVADYRTHTGNINDDFIELIMRAGYDGVVNGVIGTNEEYMVFEPNQIKSISNTNPTHSDNINEYFGSLKESYLNEDIDGMRKFYPNIEDDAFMTFIELDPTYTNGSTNAGKYARWILGLANKGMGKIENISHLSDALRRFDEVRNDLINKDVMRYKSVQELEDALNAPESYAEKSHRQEVRGRQQARKEADITKDADIVYQDATWTVYVPKTYAASCKLGQGSKWCTASTESDYYYNYYLSAYPDSKYYIVINNSNPDEKYQLHFESGQFMDKDDERIHGGIDAFKEYKGLYEFLKGLQASLFLNQIGVSAEEKEYEVKITHADLAEALSDNYSRDALGADAIRNILDGNAWDLFDGFSNLPRDEIQSVYDYEISSENLQKIEELGATEESIFDDRDDVYYAIGGALADALLDNAVSNIERSVESGIEEAMPAWAHIDDIGFGYKKSTFTVDTQTFKDAVSDIMNNYDTDAMGSLEEVLQNVIDNNSNGIYYEDDYDYDKDTFNALLADNLSELKPQ